NNLNNEIAQIDVSSENIEKLNQVIFELKMTYDKKMALKESKDKFQLLNQKYNETEIKISEVKEQISDLKVELEKIDKTNI
ncbi:hypothetical protein Q0M59_19510, partial [Staphylococcus aureus]|nr:hypothetical protein [Staphylococcus aureus]